MLFVEVSEEVGEAHLCGCESEERGVTPIIMMCTLHNFFSLPIKIEQYREIVLFFFFTATTEDNTDGEKNGGYVQYHNIMTL